MKGKNKAETENRGNGESGGERTETGNRGNGDGGKQWIVVSWENGLMPVAQKCGRG